MFACTILSMAPNVPFAILYILGEIWYKNTHGSQCVIPVENEYKNRTMDIQNLSKILNVSQWTYCEANNLSQNTQCGIDQTSLLTKTFELCFLTMCFDVKCSCVDAKKDTCSLNTTADGNTRLRTGETTLNCMIFNTRINETKNGQEKQNDVQKREYRPLAVAFILGTVFGCVIFIFPILFCRNRQSKKQTDSLENIQLYSKFVGETSAYSEISESNQNGQELADDVGANTGEYMEPISKNTILQKALTSLADQEENRENNAYFTLTLDRRQADGDGYNHLKPNTGRLPTSPVNQEHDSLYHTMAGAESEIAQVDNEPAENPAILEKDTDDGCITQRPDVESKSVQGESLQDERPYSVCIHVRDITGNDDPDSEMQERNENTNTDDAYFVLEKQIV
nr:uncharacterized protein LOC117683264 [Crassostrea gigas]XP_034308259.1 uncharacterized protein LOC117683264 [Crassostrea gigas]